MDYLDIAPIMSRLWAPIAVASTAWQGKLNGQTLVAIAGASIVPDMPRVIVQLYKRNYTPELVRKSGVFSLSFLRADQMEVARHFGFRSGRDFDKFAGVQHFRTATGSPVLADCLGFLDCSVVNAMDGGDMTCFLADVVDGRMLSEGEPLYWHDMRSRMPAAWLEEWNAKMRLEIEYSRQAMRDIDYSPWRP